MGRISVVNRHGQMVAIAIVDDDDYGQLNQHRWHLHRAGSGYAYRTERGRTIFMHRQLLHVDEDHEIDHLNGSTLDNQRSNLRIVTHAQNMQNRILHRNNTSGFRGVFPSRNRKRWQAQVQVSDVKHNLGTFDTKREASRVALVARQQLMTHAVA